MPEFRLLGSLEVRTADGASLPIGAAKLRSLLAALLLKANRTVTTDQLIGRVWEGHPPVRALAVLQNYILRLRRALGEHGSKIRTSAGGYRIELPANQLDVTHFEHLLTEADTTTDPEHVSRVLSQALNLWHGNALTGISSETLLREEAPRLEELRLHATERRIDADLEIGRHATLVAELRSLTAEHPLRERFWCQLMLALHRSGRRAEALQAFHQISTLLSDELGLDPGPELQHHHATILFGSPTMPHPRTPATVAYR